MRADQSNGELNTRGSEPGENGSLSRMRGDRRRDLIRELLLTVGEASIPDLAQRYGVSPMTIYRDLAELERQGVVRRSHGGVTVQPSAVFESNVAFRIKAMQHEKDAIALEARRLIEPGMSIILDDSTTSVAMAQQLGGIEPLTVLTNHLLILRILSEFEGIRVIGLGGDYDSKYDSFVGLSCIAALQDSRVDMAFMSAYGISQGQVFHQDQHIVSIKRAMVASAQQKILLADHTKIQRVALHRVCALTSFDLVIVDEALDTGLRHELEDYKVPYRLAPMATRSP